MNRGWGEAVPLGHGREYPVEFFQRNVNGAPTRFADEMVMIGPGGDVDDSRAVTEMDVVEPAESLEHIERAIHGRLVDLDSGLVGSPAPDIGSRQVILVTFGQDTTDGAPCRSNPKSLIPKGADENF